MVRVRNGEQVVGVLALQGDFAEHAAVLKRLGAEPREVRSADDVPGCSGLIIPGGESTVMSLLLDRFGLREVIKNFNGAVWGTCAGAILLAKTIQSPLPHPSPNWEEGARKAGGGEKTRPLGLMDIDVERNAYGRQTESFEADIEVRGMGKIRGIFIRAPKIIRAGPDVEIPASHEGSPVLARQGRFLAGTFHPELTDNPVLHEYFLSLCRRSLLEKQPLSVP